MDSAQAEGREAIFDGCLGALHSALCRVPCALCTRVPPFLHWRRGGILQPVVVVVAC